MSCLCANLYLHMNRAIQGTATLLSQTDSRHRIREKFVVRENSG